MWACIFKVRLLCAAVICYTLIDAAVVCLNAHCQSAHTSVLLRARVLITTMCCSYDQNSQQALQDPEQQYKCTLALREGLSLLLALAQPPAALEDWEVAAVTNRYTTNSHSSSSSSGSSGSGVAAGRSELCLLALSLLRHCCMVAANRAKLVALKVMGLFKTLNV
jgi:hypothetical protein